jgi:hypothetical protein
MFNPTPRRTGVAIPYPPLSLAATSATPTAAVNARLGMQPSTQIQQLPGSTPQGHVLQGSTLPQGLAPMSSPGSAADYGFGAASGLGTQARASLSQMLRLSGDGTSPVMRLLYEERITLTKGHGKLGHGKTSQG